MMARAIRIVLPVVVLARPVANHRRNAITPPTARNRAILVQESPRFRELLPRQAR